MTGLTTVYGYGAVGRAIVDALALRGNRVRVAQRSRPKALPTGVEYMPCDVLDAADVRRALQDASQAVLAVEFAYDARVWPAVWPRTMTNMIEECAEAGSRLAFIDGLYQLGPQTGPLNEDMALTTAGEKPAIRTEITHIWQAARDRVRVAALRCPDFYGPGVPISHLGASAFGEITKGNPAQLLVPPDIPHDFAYVPDIARAAGMLLDAPDEDFGQVWNMPCAPTRNPRALLAIGAATLGKRLRVWAVPFALLPLIGLFYRFGREVVDVGFTWDRAYVVDGGKFTRRFGFATTPFEVGIPATIHAFAGSR